MPTQNTRGPLASSGPRHAANVTLPAALLRQRRDLKINVPQACERGVSAQVSKARAQRWLRKNHAAMEAWNDHVERYGLPLARFRQV